MEEEIARFRRGAGYAANTFERLWPRPSELRGCAELLADAIERAVEIGGAWSVTLDPDNVRLNVGMVRLLSFSEGRFWFAATVPAVEPPKWLSDVSDRETVYNAVPVPSRGYVASSSRAADLPPAFRGAFLEYVAEAARRRKGSSLWAYAHSASVVTFLNEYLGRTLPQPPGTAAAADAPVAGGEASDTRDFIEGERRTLVHDVHERDPRARRACIEARGTRCAACGLSFAERYGALGAGFIEVHHLTPIAHAEGARPVDPARDLVPVCPNCHRMLHREDPPLAPEELRRRIAEADRAAVAVGAPPEE